MIFRFSNINIGTNQSIIEIVDSDSALGCLKQSDFSNNLIVYLPLELSFGNLKSLDYYDRSCLKELYPNIEKASVEEDFIFQKEIGELKKYIEKIDKIRVWSSHISTNEYLLLLYICYLFPDKNISAVFSDEYIRTIGEEISRCWYISCMEPKEVNELSKKEHLLTLEEKKNYINKWQKIVEENSDIRYIENNEVKSVSFEYFDEIILSYLSNRKINFYKLVAELMADKVIDYSTDSIYIYLINRLIKQGKIEVVSIENEQKLIRAKIDNTKIGG